MEKTIVRSYRDLELWQKSMELATLVYRLTQEFPREEAYGLTSQLRGAAVSIPSNIAEGQGRLNTGEFKQFLGVAKGSVCELQTQLEIARTLGFGNQKLIDQAEELSRRAAMMIVKLPAALRLKAG